MRAVSLLACIALAGCASSGSSTAGGPAVASGPRESTTTVETISDAGTVELRSVRSDPTASFAIAAPPDAVWRALTSVYSDLDLSVTVLDTQGRRLGVENVRVRRRLGGERLSRYLTCGERMGQPIAESDDINLTLYTQVVPAAGGSGSTLRTLLEATAKQTAAGGSLINCATTGALERRIVDMVKAQTAG